MNERRVALVTGASRGIGAATALELAKNGFDVIVGYKENRDLALKTANEICLIGRRADIFCADVGDYDAVCKMKDFAAKTFGFVDTIVNNAGISHYKMFVDMTPVDYDMVMNTDLKGVFNVSRLFVPDMVSAMFGRIINVSSMWGLVGSSLETLYSAAKAGVIGFTKSLAKELGASGITVNAVAPGVINTDMLKDIDGAVVKSLIDDTPLMRIGQPSDVAKVIVGLAQRQSFITGEVINVSGGFVVT